MGDLTISEFSKCLLMGSSGHGNPLFRNDAAQRHVRTLIITGSDSKCDDMLCFGDIIEVVLHQLLIAVGPG